MQQFFHSIKRRGLTQTSAFCSISATARGNYNISNEIVILMNSVNPIGPALDKVSQFLNREVVVAALQSQVHLEKDPRICFQFFVWAAQNSRFRSGVSHNLIVDLLLRGERLNSFDVYWSVLDELSSENVPIPADAFSVLILAYWRLGKAEKAVETFGRMRDYNCKPNLTVYNVILNVLVKKGVILLALAIYNKLMKTNCRMACDTYNTLIDGLCKNGMTDAALNLFDEMTGEGITPSGFTYTVVVSGLCRAKRTNDAYRLFQLMKKSGCKPVAATYNALLDGFCKTGHIEEALTHCKLFMEEGYKIGLRGYTSLVTGLIRVKRLSEAEELIQTISLLGLGPDVVLYTVMMQGLCESGKLEEATKMLQDMMARGIMPNTRTYNVLINGFCKAGLLDNARSLKLEISHHNQFPDTYTYTIMICGLCRNGLLGEAQQIFNDMEKLGCSPSVATFNALIDGLCKSGRVEEANIMRYKMEIGKNPSLFLRLAQGSDRVSDSASLRKMVENMVESGSVLKAYKLLMQLADSGVVPDIKTYNCLINGLCKGAQIDGAFKLFEELQLRGHVPDATTYNTLMDGLQRMNREEDAFKLFEQMKKNGCKPSSGTYHMLMTWSCRRRKISVAFDIWLESLRILAGRDGEALKSAEECFQKGDYADAARCLLELDVKMSGFESSPYNIWLIGLCQVQKLDEALKAFSLLGEYDILVSAPACVHLIRALCASKVIDKAVDVFLYSMMKGYLLKRPICNMLFQCLLTSTAQEAITAKEAIAVELLDRMKSVGYDLKSHLDYTTRSLLRSQCAAVSLSQNKTPFHSSWHHGRMVKKIPP